jgi:hypothetical protein
MPPNSPPHPDHFARAESIFHEVMKLPGHERLRAAEAACAGDTVLLGEVASLVEASGT